MLCLLYCCYCLLLFVLQRQMMFPHYAAGRPAAPSLEKTGVELLWIDTSEGKIEAWFLPPAGRKDGSPAPAVIFAHGNAELIDYGPAEFRRFSEIGVGVLFVEFPGYGRSPGSPSQESITETFVKAYERLVERDDVDNGKIVLYGRSLGGGAVCALADERPSAALILQSTFTSARSFARRYLAPGFLVRDPFDNLAVVKRYEQPVLIIHGRYDETIPYRHGTALAAAARDARMITYECGHNDCPPDADRFWRDIEQFMAEIGVIENSQAMR